MARDREPNDPSPVARLTPWTHDGLLCSQTHLPRETGVAGSAGRKLIEVALPVEAINEAAAHEKSVPRRGHPATMHLWWARRPLAVCRAVVFAQLVDDPSARPEKFPTPESQEAERKRLLDLVADLAKWKSATDADVLSRARAEILSSCGGSPPTVLDPFCGGGSIPLEAHRLGLNAIGTDLNPVPVLITKSLVEIPPRLAGQTPVRHGADASAPWPQASGLADDIRYYGRWMRERAIERIGHLYPEVPAGRETLPVVAWLWARTVRCPNPACGARAPLVRSFRLSSKPTRPVWVQPVLDGESGYRFLIGNEASHAREGTIDRQGGECLVCGTPISLAQVRAEARAGRMGTRLMCIVAEGRGRRAYLAPNGAHEEAARQARPKWRPDRPLEGKCRVSMPLYGMETFGDLFSPRQLVALETFSSLVGEARRRAIADAMAAGKCEADAEAYGDALAVYLAFAVDKLADWNSTLCSWIHRIEGVRNTFARHALPMVWDYVETNPFSSSVGNFAHHIEWVANGVAGLPARAPAGRAYIADAAAPRPAGARAVVCTDPPYYDNIEYADLSEFFLVWLQRSLGGVLAETCGTGDVSKADELVASPFRDLPDARGHFETGMSAALARLREVQDERFPIVVFYGLKPNAVSSGGKRVSAGWEAMLGAIVAAGLRVTAAWPLRSERQSRSLAHETNALASAVVLACRPRQNDAPTTTWDECREALMHEMPLALEAIVRAGTPPVDVAQAAIGPGMAVFTAYSRVTDQDGRPVTIGEVLAAIADSVDAFLCSAPDGTTDSMPMRALTQALAERVVAGGPAAAADAYRAAGAPAEEHIIRLAYALHREAERQGAPRTAHAYNRLVVTWPQIRRLAEPGPGRHGGES